jgi:hypothetical protein
MTQSVFLTALNISYVTKILYFLKLRMLIRKNKEEAENASSYSSL